MIEVEHLSKIYGSTAAISDVDFTVEKGEILGFLGPNGAGKTTTMRILSGYIPATTGTARIAGYDVHQQSLEVRRRIGYLPENPPLYPEMTVESFLDFVARIKGISSGDRKARVDLVLSKCQLLEKRKVIIRKLSKGYKQRVGIAQAIVHDPPVIILDEPTVGLDPKQIIEVRNLIKSLAGEHTIILSTHILPEVSITCDRATIINRGRIVANNITTATPASSSYEIEIEGDRDSLLEILQQLPQVEQAAKVGDNLLKIVGQVGTNLGAELARIVVNNGYNLLEMRRTRKTLEDIFLEVIGSGENNHQEERHDQ
ncbi:MULTISPECIES: ATP-binding cassette domain-containing protein [unclassified Microcystis]|uniref:ATP-binding cassette domain-containing protein n=1 Tax=Microcystis aeruginosa Ma_QC_Ca_00000000_S207 TaxID=2486251 RepID=A0A552FF08_MICAE|nr:MULTISPECIES: ATP-binding cassette domain-containing protein [unclassified Microcystis]MCA2925553.1 ATP-binding cassette domain-containing protein [Microcystis sp. M020S1]MCA2935808.1 ATP-binding cassette domain-containing protein [Microcystis sp. M015S1]TRU45318.1 MAG: ATP-binding cassette domain-containing protein [Microcystis aeruginosa Ma_QC_Ca_00000000_S207]MCA2621606.1 ATP-binding cassette domain-containing protein [Microcystis sp. M099S2]MCA2652418.1 ATP-binding cassette domain-conta